MDGGGSEMNEVFLYWDQSSILLEAQRLAEERDEGPNARSRVRINIDNLLRLAKADRPLKKAFAVGSVLTQMHRPWKELEDRGVEVKLHDRGYLGSGEQETPDGILQLRMLEDALDYIDNPGIMVLLTGNGAGCLEGDGFHSTLERIHRRGWQVEVLSWTNRCNGSTREWAERNGVFIALDEYYSAITLLRPPPSGQASAQPRGSTRLDLSRRVTRARRSVEQTQTSR